MSGGVHGGRYASINGIYSVQNWSINDNGQLAQAVNSGTAIGHLRRTGIQSWGGQYTSHGAQPQIMPGNSFAFTGYTAPDDDIKSHAGMAYSGTAYAASVAISWDWTSGAVLQHQVNFEGSLGLTVSAGAYPPSNASDISDPEPVGVTSIQYSPDGSVWTTLGNIAQAQLQFQNGLQSYVNSSTGGLTGRKPGILDWSASLNVEDTLEGSGLVKGSAYQWRFYTTATKFYLLKWGRVQEYTNLQAAPSTGAIIAHTINIQMSGNEDVAGTPTIGSILLPDTTSYWP